MTDIAELIARLEAATEGSQELDEDIWKIATPDEWARHCWFTPLYTTSLDAALTLVPAGWLFDLTTDRHASFLKQAAHATVMSCTWSDPLAGHGKVEDGHAATPALALCIAALKARSAS